MPGTETKVLNFVMKGNTADFTRKWTTASGLMNRVGARANAVGAMVQGFGTKMTLGFTVPVVAGLGAGAKAFASFDKAMTESLAIMSDVTSQLRQEMEATAMQMSGESTFSATKLAEAYFFLASAGLSAKQSIEALPVVTKFAQAGAFDMAQATDLLTDAYSALGPQIQKTGNLMKDMTGLSDILVKANTLANATVEQFSSALTNEAGPAMRQWKIATEDGVAVLAAYADQGIKGEVAGSKFGRAIRLLTKAYLENTSEFKKLGIEIFNAQGEFNSFADIAEDLERALGSLSTKQKAVTLDMLGFKARTQQAILPLIGVSDKIRKYRQELEQAGGITETVANKQMKAFSNQVTALKNRIVNAFTEIGGIVIPTITSIMGKMDELIQKWNGVDKSTKEAIVKFLSITAAIGPFALAIAGIIKLFGLFLVAIDKVAIAVGFLVANPLLGFIVALGALYVQAKKATDLFEEWQDASKELTKSEEKLLAMEKKYGSLESIRAQIANTTKESAKAEEALGKVMDSNLSRMAKITQLEGLLSQFSDTVSKEVKDKISKALEDTRAEFDRFNNSLKAKPFVMGEEDKEARDSFQDKAKEAMFGRLTLESKLIYLARQRKKLEDEMAGIHDREIGKSKRYFELQDKILATEEQQRDAQMEAKDIIKGKVEQMFDPQSMFVGAMERGSVEEYRLRTQGSVKQQALAEQKKMQKELMKLVKGDDKNRSILEDIRDGLGFSEDLQEVSIL